jgi:hypothetical protein
MLRCRKPERLVSRPPGGRRGVLLTAASAAFTLAALIVPATVAEAATLPAPTSLSTSPGTSCPSATPTTIGDDDVTFYAGIPGSLSSSVNATFDVWDTATSATLVNGTVQAAPGTNAVLLVQHAAFETAAAGAITEFSWNVTISDGTDSSPTSVTCSFFFDPTRPGNPVITPAESSYTIGTSASFTFSPDTSGSTTAGYSYQLNGGAPRTVTAGASGTATGSVTPTSGFNTLTVTAESPGGNLGGTATFQFSAATPPPAADGDMTGDGIPDLVTVGGTRGVPSGLWLAAGKPAANGTTGSGEVVTPAVDIGTSGVGFIGDQSPADFDGAQVITGQFMGEGLQDYLVYYPSGKYAGVGAIVPGNGHGSFLDLTGGITISSAEWTSTDPNGDIPLQIANGYHADPNDNPSTPALLTVSGDATHGYYLEYYNSYGTPGAIFTSVPLTTTTTPDGTMDWNDWQIATSADASGDVDLFLYNAATRDLYLWRDFTIDDTDSTASFTPYRVSSNWRPGPITTLRAADINGDGTPDLWTVSPDGKVIGWLVSGLATHPAINAGHAQWLVGQS